MKCSINNFGDGKVNAGSVTTKYKREATRNSGSARSVRIGLQLNTRNRANRRARRLPE